MGDDIDTDAVKVEPVSKPIIPNLQSPMHNNDGSDNKLKTYIEYAFRITTLLLIPVFIWIWETEKTVNEVKNDMEHNQVQIAKVEKKQEKNSDRIRVLEITVGTMEGNINAAIKSIETAVDRIEKTR